MWSAALFVAALLNDLRGLIRPVAEGAEQLPSNGVGARGGTTVRRAAIDARGAGAEAAVSAADAVAAGAPFAAAAMPGKSDSATNLPTCAH